MPQKFETISHSICQIMWEIVSNYAAFLENLKFNDLHCLTFDHDLSTNM